MSVKKSKTTPPSVFIVSGGTGASGEQIVETVLAQFPECQVSTLKMGYVRLIEQVEEIVSRARIEDATVVHTLVDRDLRESLVKLGNELNVVTIDLMGPLLGRLADVSGQNPRGQPGLYRKLRERYFKRVEAIEFTMAHDDGKNSQDLLSADLVITGVSRSGKTPLSMYLAVLGWKVANIPIILESPLPLELGQIDRRRGFGLDIDHERLMNHRLKRQGRMGIPTSFPYADPRCVFEELEYANKLFRKYGFTVLSVTNKPIESTADEIIEMMTRRFPERLGNFSI
jgi:regulator of PEP synthase PpsR (kinase-PPPase family)